MTEVAVCVYDFTIHEVRPAEELRELLKEHCKKYCFQLEEGEKTHKQHYQGRISLKTKKRLPAAAKIFAGWKAHLSPTSKENRDNNFYVCKEDTRIAGPFTDENEVYVPRDVRGIQKLYPWQEKLRDELLVYDTRKVDIVYDTIGNNGKTTFARYMMLYHDAELLPFCNEYKDIMRMTYDVEAKKIYLIDAPRAIDKEKLKQFYSACETIKTGFAYDDRNKYKRRLFDPPRVCIFTNKLPKGSYLSEDRWNYWQIINRKLKKFTPEDENAELLIQ